MGALDYEVSEQSLRAPEQDTQAPTISHLVQQIYALLSTVKTVGTLSHGELLFLLEIAPAMEMTLVALIYLMLKVLNDVRIPKIFGKRALHPIGDSVLLYKMMCNLETEPV